MANLEKYGLKLVFIKEDFGENTCSLHELIQPEHCGIQNCEFQIVLFCSEFSLSWAITGLINKTSNIRRAAKLMR